MVTISKWANEQKYSLIMWVHIYSYELQSVLSLCWWKTQPSKNINRISHRLENGKKEEKVFFRNGNNLHVSLILSFTSQCCIISVYYSSYNIHIFCLDSTRSSKELVKKEIILTTFKGFVTKINRDTFGRTLNVDEK